MNFNDHSNDDFHLPETCQNALSGHTKFSTFAEIRSGGNPLSAFIRLFLISKI